MKSSILRYVEYAKIYVENETVLEAIATGSHTKSIPIPYGNLHALMLGPGTSITQEAARLLSESGTGIGFCSSGMTPVFLSSNQYRPNHYAQGWARRWIGNRLEMCEEFMNIRIGLCKKNILSNELLDLETIKRCLYQKSSVGKDPFVKIETGIDTGEQSIERFLGLEGSYVKNLMSLYREVFLLSDDPTAIKSAGRTELGRMIQHSNYLAYGLASCAIFLTGLSTSFPLLHGATRRGGVVFDVADLIKDSVTLPMAMYAYAQKFDEKEMRRLIVDSFEQVDALGQMLAAIKALSGVSESDDDTEKHVIDDEIDFRTEMLIKEIFNKEQA
jgi:CRISPR-associated protein Cas1